MEAIQSITSRRLNCGDTSLDFMGEGPGEAVAYVLTHRQGIPRGVLAADAGDALELVHWLQGDLDRLEYEVITLARSMGVTWAKIAVRLGLRSRQAAEQRYLRLRSVHAKGPRSSQAGRRDRDAELRRAQTKGQKEGWALSRARMIEDAAWEVIASPLPDSVDGFTEEVTAALGLRRRDPQDLWTALRYLLGDMRSEQCMDVLTPEARGLVDDLLADWDTRFPSQAG